MKILEVIGSMNPQTGGPCQVVRDLAPYVLEQGHSIEVVCLDDPHSEYLQRDKFTIHALGASRGSWGYQPALKLWLDENLARFDAVILNGLWQYHSYALSKASKRVGMPPYFLFPHGMLDPWFQRAPGRRIKAIRNWIYWKLIEKNHIRQAEAIFFTCEEEMRLARQSFSPYQPKREVNVRLGVTQPPAYHEKMKEALTTIVPLAKDKPYFLFLGRVHPKKGVDLLIKAYAAIHRTVDAKALALFPKLVIAGPGLDTEYGRDMQVLASNLCPDDSILWPGMIAGDAKWGALYNAEAFALTSHQENFGIAVAEALGCGTPVLISNQVNIWREIQEDGAGLVAGDTVEGAENLFRRWIAISPEERTKMKTAAKASFDNRFDIGRVARHLLNAIEELRHRPPLKKAA